MLSKGVQKMPLKEGIERKQKFECKMHLQLISHYLLIICFVLSNVTKTKIRKTCWRGGGVTTLTPRKNNIEFTVVEISVYR